MIQVLCSENDTESIGVEYFEKLQNKLILVKQSISELKILFYPFRYVN